MNNKNIKIAIFGGGCFWCTEEAFKILKGVISVIPGYAGGDIKNPIYKQVSTGKTGHAEVSKVQYDSSIISYNDLLSVFFASHNPESLNRQGADIGSQYRSIILYTNNSQKNQAKNFIENLKQNGLNITTEVKKFKKFYPAEEYHQNYYEKHKSAPYCLAIINPKLAKLRKKFKSLIVNS